MLKIKLIHAQIKLINATEWTQVDLRKIDTKADRILQSNSIALHSPRIEFFNSALHARDSRNYFRYSSQREDQSGWIKKSIARLMYNINEFTHKCRSIPAIAPPSLRSSPLCAHRCISAELFHCSEILAHAHASIGKAQLINRMLISITIMVFPACFGRASNMRRNRSRSPLC